jgi:hypothetical protein
MRILINGNVVSINSPDGVGIYGGAYKPAPTNLISY